MLDILFPQKCHSCHAPYPNNSNICRSCYDDIKYVSEWSYCRKCGVPFGFFNNETDQYSGSESQRENTLCAKCIKDFYSFNKARSIAIMKEI